MNDPSQNKDQKSPLGGFCQNLGKPRFSVLKRESKILSLKEESFSSLEINKKEDKGRELVNFPSGFAGKEIRRARARNFLGRCSGGLDRRGHIEALGTRLLPPYPGPTVVPELTIPAPALLPPDLSPTQKVLRLAAAFRGAAISRGRSSRFFLYGNANPRSHRSFDVMFNAAQRMAAEGIPPVAWVEFSYDVFPHTNPAAKWVFSLKRLESARDWFENRRGDFSFAMTLICPEHRQLATDWKALWHHLLRADPTTRQEVEAIMDVHFPRDSWETRVQSAKSEVVNAQHRINRQVINCGDGAWRYRASGLQEALWLK